MRKATVALAIALLVAALLWLVRARHAGEGRSPRGSPSEPALEAKEERTAEDDSHGWLQGLAPQKSPLEGRVIVKGTSRAPSTPVTVKVIPDASESVQRTYQGVTRADGGFTIPDVLWPIRCKVVCSSTDGWVYLETDATLAIWDRDSRVIKLVLEVEERSVIVGSVVNEWGDPLAGARVVASVTRNIGEKGFREDTYDTNAGADGRFLMRVSRVQRTDSLRVGAVANGYMPVEGQCRVLDAVRYETEIRLKGTPVLKGRVVDEQGRPIANASIGLGSQVTWMRTRERLNGWLYGRIGVGVTGYGPTNGSHFTEVVVAWGRTDDAGRFELTTPFPGSRYYLIARIEDAPTHLSIFPAAQMEASDFTVDRIELRRPAKPMALRLVYGDGSPAVGVELAFQMVPQWLQINSAWVRADGDGVVCSRALAEDVAYTLYIRGGPRGIHKNVTGFFARHDATVTVD